MKANSETRIDKQSTSNQDNQQAISDDNKLYKLNCPNQDLGAHQLNRKLSEQDKILKNAQLFNTIRKNKISEKKLQKIKKHIDEGADINTKDANDKNNAPLHIAVLKGELEIVKFLLAAGAIIDEKNGEGKTPLDIAKQYNRQNIVQLFDTHINSYPTEKQSSQQQFMENFHSKSNEYEKNNKQCIKKTKETSSNSEICQKSTKYTGGLDGHFYEIDLLLLCKLRGETQTDEFYLCSNVPNLGAFDDIVFRYRIKDESKIIFLQAKHADNAEKNEITIEKFMNSKNFKLNKYLLSYLKCKNELIKKSDEILFQGNYEALDPKFIIYTNSVLNKHFDEHIKVDIGDSIFSTKSKVNKDKTFKFNLDDGKNSDLIKMLVDAACTERINLLAENLVDYFCGKLNPQNVMKCKCFQIHHVFLAKNIFEVKEEIKEEEIEKQKTKKDKKIKDKIEETEGDKVKEEIKKYKEDKVKKENNKQIFKYRESNINYNFFNIGNEDRVTKEFKESFLCNYANNEIFNKKTNLNYLQVKTEQDDLANKVANSLISSETIDEDIVKKLGGIVILLDTIKKKLKFVNEKKLTDESVKHFIGKLKNKVSDFAKYEFNVPWEVLKNILKEKTEKEIFKLPATFGNINTIFMKEGLIKKFIKLFEKHKNEKIIKIDNTTVGSGKLLTSSDIRSIGNLVGNLLVFDSKEKMLRLANVESLNGEALNFITQLKHELKGLELSSYKFDIKLEDFPSDSLFYIQAETTAKDFLNRLEIHSGQANDKELEDIIKDEIRSNYKLTTEEVECNFIKIRDKTKSFWKKETNCKYLKKDDDFIPTILRFNFEFNVVKPTIYFTGRNKELEILHNVLQNQKSQIACITGLGGIGKSELAKKYISEYSNSYDNNLIWIDAKNSCVESFHRLAKDKLKINIKDANGFDISIKSIVEEVYRFFSKRKSIFIFDDVEDCNSIVEFLPLFSNPNSRKPHVLITSRDSKYSLEDHGEIKVLPLQVFTSDQAKTFVKEYLEMMVNDSCNGDIKELTKVLGKFPLALRQAVAYIKQKNEKLKKSGKERFEISNYLITRREHESKLLNEGYYKNSNQYTKTVLTTWITTIEKITNYQTCGKTAIYILYIISYFAPHRINITELLKFKEQKMEEINEALRLLDRYSMINLKEGIVDIHSLVQEVTRQNLKRKEKEEKVLNRYFQNCKLNVSINDLSHIISIWKYACEYPKLIHEWGESLYKIKKSGYSYYAVHLLVKSGKKDAMDKMLKHLPKMLDKCCVKGRTLLDEAIISGNHEIVNCLVVNYKFDLNKNYNFGFNKIMPITLAAHLGKENLVKYFVRKGADVNKDNISRTLCAAVFSGKKKLSKLPYT